MSFWFVIIVPSALFGIGCAFFVKSRASIYVAGGLPWLCLFTYVLYEEFFVPYQGGGASMWPIAVLFGGAITAGTAIAAWWLAKRFFVGSNL